LRFLQPHVERRLGQLVVRLREHVTPARHSQPRPTYRLVSLLYVSEAPAHAARCCHMATARSVGKVYLHQRYERTIPPMGANHAD
jgi:hypothetical protein